jgi:hypothetical protein
MFYAQMEPTANAGLIVAKPTRFRAPPVDDLAFFHPAPRVWLHGRSGGATVEG